MTATVESGLSKTTSSGYFLRLAARISDSHTLPLIFENFSRYGKSGRFHHLDILATDEPHEDVPPARYWERVEHKVQETEPEFRDVPYSDHGAFEQYLSRLRGRLAAELETWWFCIHRLGVQGCFGELGKKIGSELWEPGRPSPSVAGV